MAGRPGYGLRREARPDSHHLHFHIDRHSLTQGNAVVAVRDASGTILWSWQIWATYYDLSKNTGYHPITAKVSNNTYYLAPVNLGYCDRHKGNDERKFKLRIFWLWDHRDNNGIPQPFSATMTTHPLLYNLWNGLRTEPFNDEVVPGSSATDEQKAAWTAAEIPFSKTIYDPCPTGFHVPNNHILSHFFKEGTGGGPDSATWDNYVSVMIDDEGGGETIGEKFKDSAGNPIIFYFVGLRDHRYPLNERPAEYPDDYTVPAHRHIIALGTTCSQPASVQTLNFGSGNVDCHRSNRPTPIWFDIRKSKGKNFVITIGSNASYGFNIRPVHD